MVFLKKTPSSGLARQRDPLFWSSSRKFKKTARWWKWRVMKGKSPGESRNRKDIRNYKLTYTIVRNMQIIRCWDSVSASPPTTAPFACRVFGVKALGYALRALLDESQWCPKHGKAVCTLAVKLGCMTEEEWGAMIYARTMKKHICIDVYLYTYRFIDINVLTKEVSHKKRPRKDAISIVIHYQVFQHSTSNKNLWPDDAVQRKNAPGAYFLGFSPVAATREVRVTTFGGIQLQVKRVEVTRDDMMHLMWPYASLEDMDHMGSVFDHCRCRCLGWFLFWAWSKKRGKVWGNSRETLPKKHGMDILVRQMSLYQRFPAFKFNCSWPASPRCNCFGGSFCELATPMVVDKIYPWRRCLDTVSH